MICVCSENFENAENIINWKLYFSVGEIRKKSDFFIYLDFFALSTVCDFPQKTFFNINFVIEYSM